MAQAYNQFSPLNALAYVQEQGEMGRARGQQNQLAQLASQSYAANTPEQRQQLLTSMAVVNPAAAQDQQQQFQGNEDRQRKLAYGAATYLKGALDTKNPAAIAGAWRSVRPGLINAGIGTEADYAQDWQPDYEKVVHQLLASGDGVNGQTPTDVRSFQLMTAGLSAEDRERARRVNLGLDGRASSSGFSQVKVTGADGRERVGVLNGRTGQIDLPDGTSFNPQNGAITPTQGGAQSAPQPGQALAPGGSQQVLDQDAALANQMIAAGIPEQQVDAFLASRAASWNAGTQAQAPAALQATAAMPTNNPGAFVGRAPEDQAAATEAARLGVQQAYLPQELSMRTDAAIQQAGGTAQAKGEAEARLDAVQNLPRVMQESTNAVNLIDQALSHPGLATSVGASGRADPRNYLPGTDATDFRVLLDQIKGGTFLQAFQSLKGGGAITEVEGTKAEQAIARLNRDQSEQAFRQSLQDLREVANAAMVRAQAKAQAAGAQSVQGGGSPARIQSAADYNALPSGALFIAPDGSQRRKR